MTHPLRPPTEVHLDAAVLATWPLPQPGDDADKEARGRVLVVAGSSEMPGAAVLAATAALRAGAGKLQVAVPQVIATAVAAAIPEARVIALAQAPDGTFEAEAVEQLATLAAHSAAVLIGPGMQPEAAACALVAALLPTLTADTALVLDAGAMGVVRDAKGPAARFSTPVLFTPHAGEMASLTGVPKPQVQTDPAQVAADAARCWQAVVALKGAETWLAAPDGRRWRHVGGNAGLATSGSGDVLAGLIAGLAARGASLAQAAAWGVALHARAGERLAQRLGPLGYLAREIAGEVPALLEALSRGD
jgi:hydroxyethylthiazole kinase-like uncharacterized protein yjeF